MVWLDNALVIHEGEFELAQPVASSEYIHEFAGSNWVITEGCLQNACVVLGIEDTERRTMVRMLLAVIFLPMLLVFILTMSAIYLAVTSTLKPLSRLATLVSSTSPDKLGHIEEGSQSDELKPLVDALNKLIKRMRIQLQDERQFLDTCTHELRTPITALVANIQCLEALEHSDEKQSAKLDGPRFSQIRQSALRTVRVANQFLAFGRNSNSEAMDIDERSFDLCEYVRQISADYMVEYPQLHVQLLGETHLPVRADTYAVELLVRNVIENSIKYGADAADRQIFVDITVSYTGSLVHVVFEDSGSGVAPVHHQRILERFVRLPSCNLQGAGLGLSIVQAIARRYAGSVQIACSENLGGLKVSVDLNIGKLEMPGESTLAESSSPDWKPDRIDIY